MTYQEALLHIKNLSRSGIKPGLARIKKLLKFMGDPQQNMKFIHVAGTNGKGSVCFMLANILKKSGYKTGLYISPSIEDFRERIQINGSFISKTDLCNILKHIKKFYFAFESDMLSEFELTTAIAFEYFKQQNCDVIVLETGMGGKFDATNVIKNSLCSIITGISYDHTNFLGSTIEEISKEKLGIIKNNSKVVLGENQEDIVYSLAKEISMKKNSELYIASSDTIKNFKSIEFKKSIFEYKNESLEVNLIGDHQKRNISIVLKVIEVLRGEIDISLNDIKNGLKDVTIPCRLQALNLNPLVILDASHNVESITALTNFIKNNLESKNVIGICSMLADKDIEKSFEIIGKYLSKSFIVKSDSERAADVTQLKEILQRYCSNVYVVTYFDDKLKKEILDIPKNDVIIVFGSFSIMKDAKKFFKLCF